MNQTELQEIYSSATGTAASASSAAAQLADAITSGHSNLSDVINLFALEYSFLNSPPAIKDIVTMTAVYKQGSPYFGETCDYKHFQDNVGDTVEEIAAQIKEAYLAVPDNYKSGGLATLTINNNVDVFVITLSQNSIYINDFMVIRAAARTSPQPQGGDIYWLDTLPEHVVGEVRSIKDIIYSVLSGFGVVENFANVLRHASTVLSGTGEDLSATVSSVSNYIMNQNWLTALDKDDLVNGISNGIQSLIQVVANKFISYKRAADKASDDGDSTFLSTTSISISNFAPGVILGTLQSVMSVVSIVAFAVSKVIGAVLIIAQTALEVVSRIFLAAATDYEATKFRIRYTSNTSDSVFSFCVDQRSNISHPLIAQYMRELGVARITLEPGEYSPLMYYIYLSNPEATEDDYDYNYISYETHLSLMFDVFFGKAVAARSGGLSQDLQSLLSYWGFSGQGVGNTGELLFTPHSNYFNLFQIEDPETRKFIFLTSLMTDTVQPYDSGPVSLPFATLARMNTTEYLLSPLELNKLCYRPISFSKFSRLTWLFNNSDQIVVFRRLCSALLLLLYDSFGYPLLMDSMGRSYAANTWLIPCFDAANGKVTWTSGNNTVEITTLKLIDFMRSLLGPVINNGAAITDMQTDINQIHTHVDRVITGISTLFNKVLFPTIIRNCVDKTYNHCYLYAIAAPANASVTWDDFVKVDLQNEGIASLVNFGTPIVIYQDNVSLLNELHVIDAWPTNFLVDLPTITFSGFIAGLIVDGVIVAAAATVAVLAVIGKVKLHNKASQLQARAEGKWWKYHDEYDESGTPEAKEKNAALWKDYKRARTKNNIFALFTGNSSMSLGMYDAEKDQSESIISKLSGYTLSSDSATSEDETSLGAIKRLITGPIIETPTVPESTDLLISRK